MGWIVHSLSGPKDTKSSPGKRPLTKDWNSRNTPLSEEQIKSEFGSGEKNIGVVCGRISGIVVIDFDDMLFFEDLVQGMDTSDWIISTRAKEGEDPSRCHVFFRYEEELPFRVAKGGKQTKLLGIDILGATSNGKGANCVIPPSVHSSGGIYHWTGKEPQTIEDIPPIPELFKKRLINFIQIENEIVSVAGKCRKWVMEFLQNPEALHGGSGRRCMVALIAEMKTNGLSDQGAMVISKVVYRDEYNQDVSGYQISKIECIPWTSERLCSEFSEYCNEKNTSGNRNRSCESAQVETSIQDPKEDVDWSKLAEAAADNVICNDPVQLAKQLQDVRPIFFDRAKVYWVWLHDELRYVMRDETDILLYLKEMLGESDGFIYDRDFKSEFLEAIRVTGRERNLSPPGSNIIQFKDGCIDINTGERFQPDPSKLYVARIPHNIGESEETPVIDNLFRSWVGEDYVRTLQEYCAYCMYDGYPIHVIFTLIGSGRNGKGQFMTLLERLIGKENVTSTDLEILASASNGRFESAKMYMKKVVLMGETNFSVLRNTAMLKQLSGSDMVRAEFKNKPNFDFINTAKITIASNSLPPTHDKTEGFYRRWMIIDFPNRFPEGKPVVDTIPEIEYENMCRKCIRILRELLEIGKFTNQGTVEERMKRYEAKSNPVVAFIDQQCICNEQLEVPLWVLFDEFERYCAEGGLRMISKKEFSRILEDLEYEVKDQKLYSIQNARKYKPEYNKQANWATVYGLGLKRYEMCRLEPKDGKTIDVKWRETEA